MARNVCCGPERLKKDDDEHKVAHARGWQSTMLLATTATVAFVGLAAAFRSRATFLTTPLQRGLVEESACPPPPEGMYIDPHRALAQLNVSKWQFRNVSWNIFPDGFPVHHYESSQSNVFELARKQWWESETFRVAKTIILEERKGKPNATVLDIGGWIGITGMYYSTVAPRVVAVEPDIVARSELVANVALNPFLEPRIRVYDKCISNKKGKITMKGDPGGSWSSILFFNDKGSLPSWEVECLTFESFLKVANVDPKDVIFIKMDIEGAEHTVLPHMRKWLKKHGNPPMWVSMHKWLWEQTDEAKNKMAAVFRDFKHVYTARLEEVPRANLEDGVKFFGDGSDSVYLLSMKQYTFLDLRPYDFADNGGPLPYPTAKKAAAVAADDDEEGVEDEGEDEEAVPVKKSLRRPKVPVEEEEEEDSGDAEESDAGDSGEGDSEDAAADDDVVEEEEEEEEIPEPPPKKKSKKSSRK